jgi:hypothetical protein
MIYIYKYMILLDLRFGSVDLYKRGEIDRQLDKNGKILFESKKSAFIYTIDKPKSPIDKSEKRSVSFRYHYLLMCRSKEGCQRCQQNKRSTMVRRGERMNGSKKGTLVRLCLDCEFFQRHFEGDEGDCRRRSPSVVESWGQSVFPIVNQNWWCGEFERTSREPEIPVKREEEKPKKAIPVWAVKKLQEVDWILVILHLKGEMFSDVVSQSKAKNAITLGVFDVESWRWLERNMSEESWQIFVIALDFFQKHPEKRMVDFESSFWRQLPEFFRAALALCQKDETTLKSLGLHVQREAPLMQIFEGKVAQNVLAPEFRGYWNMRLRLVPGSHFETHLPTGILGVAVSRLDPLYLLARGAWIVGRHK